MQAVQKAEGVEKDFTSGIRLLARLARVAERTCQESGISLPQYRLLVSLDEQARRASELASLVGVSRPTLTSLVDGLEQHGLLRRVPVPTDRRGIRLEPTDKGREAVVRAEGVMSRRLRELVDTDSANACRPVVEVLCDALDREAVAN